MKKFPLIFLSLTLAIVLASCKTNTSINQEKVDQLKELLSKQDLSDFTSKSFACMFTQEYDVLDVYNDSEDEEKNSSYYNYTSLGFLDSYYVLSDEQYTELKDENGDINIFDAIAIGEGGYRITHSAKSATFSRAFCH